MRTQKIALGAQAMKGTFKPKSCPAGISNNALMIRVEITTEIWIVFACHRADNISISLSWSKVSYF